MEPPPVLPVPESGVGLTAHPDRMEHPHWGVSFLIGLPSCPPEQAPLQRQERHRQARPDLHPREWLRRGERSVHSLREESSPAMLPQQPVMPAGVVQPSGLPAQHQRPARTAEIPPPRRTTRHPIRCWPGNFPQWTDRRWWHARLRRLTTTGTRQQPMVNRRCCPNCRQSLEAKPVMLLVSRVLWDPVQCWGEASGWGKTLELVEARPV